MTVVWRLCKRKYAGAGDVLSGAGAQAIGGRWNRAGLAAVYASSSSSLAYLEILAHAAQRAFIPPSLVFVAITIPDDVTIDSLERLASDWRANASWCERAGSDWVARGEHFALRVPSVVNPLDENVLLNPAHPAKLRCNVDAPVELEHDLRIVSLIAGG